MVAPEAKLSHAAALWALKSVVIDRLSIARVAANLGVSWHTANDAVLETGRRLLIEDPNRLDGVRVLGVDEHVWRHTRWGNRYVTVIIDLTPVADGTGSARLLDMVPGRSKQTFIAWLQAQTTAFRQAVEIVAMDGFTGYKTAATEQLPEATTVMDPFHVVALAGTALDKCRQRIQQATLGRRGKTGDPLYGIRKTLRTGQDYVTEKQRAKLKAAFEDPSHEPVKQTWQVYQQIMAAYRHPTRAQAKHDLRAVIDSISTGLPAAAYRTANSGPHHETPSRRHPGLLRSRTNQQRPNRSHQWQNRTSARHRPRLSKHPPLHHPRLARHRRIPNQNTLIFKMSL